MYFNKQRALACLAMAGASLSATLASAQSFDLAFVKGKFKQPVDVVGHPTNPSLLYVLEKAGVIKAVNGVPVTPPDISPVSAFPLLDLTPVVDSAVEQGLLGLAFHPNYSTNRRFFVKYNRKNTTGGNASDLVIMEYRMGTGTEFRVNTSIPPVQIFCATTLEQHHMGGGIEFGADGKLWVPLGDSDVSATAQDLNEPWGKVLRFDVDVNVGQQAACGDDSLYVPSDNPSLGGNAYVWSFGHRNPYSWSFDQVALGGTGAIWMGDVGSNLFEEVNVMSPIFGGASNYGWDPCEGNVGSCAGSVPPIYQYSHAIFNGCEAIIGGTVYRGSAIPSMQGRYIFADFCKGTFGQSGVPHEPDVIRSFDAAGSPLGTLANHGLGLSKKLRMPTGIGVGADGEMYIVDQSPTGTKGKLFKFVQ